jgi:hypothetical protein
MFVTENVAEFFFFAIDPVVKVHCPFDVTQVDVPL